MRKQNGYDVAIAGAGIFGLCCAWFCHRAGLKTLVLDAAAPGAGASGGIVGALSPHMPHAWDAKKQFQLTALTTAPAFWAAVTEVGGLNPGYARTGRWLPLTTEKARAATDGLSRAASQHWPEGCAWTFTPPDALPSWLSRDAAPLGAVLDGLTARIHPRQAVAALTAALKTLGVTFRDGVCVSAAAPGVLDTGEGEIHTPRIILATGTGSGRLLAPHVTGPFGSGVKGQAALLRRPANGPDRVFFTDGLYIVPHADGTIAIGSTSERIFTSATETDLLLDDLLAKARTLCPVLADAAVLERWAGVRPRAPHPDPLIGAVPGQTGLWIAGGGFKIGFGIAHHVGRLVAEMVTGHDPDVPQRFRPEGHELRPKTA